MRNALILTLSTMLLLGCGGGSSSSPQGTTSPMVPPPPPPPPPPAANNPPSISVSKSIESPNEGQTVLLDASSSTDADGDDLTYAWSQTSGRPARLTQVEDGKLQVLIPNLIRDTPMEIQLQLSDGTDAATELISIDARNLDLQPRVSEAGFVFRATKVSEVSLTNDVSKIIRVDSDNLIIYEDGDVESIYLDDSLTLQRNMQDTPFEGQISLESPERSTLVEGVFNNLQFSSQLADLRQQDVLFTNINTGESDHENIYSLASANPCSVLRPNSAGFILIGRQSGGLDIFKRGPFVQNAPPNYNYVETIAENSVFCHLSEVYRGAVIAYDEINENVVLLQLTNQSGEAFIPNPTARDETVSYTVSQTLPLQESGESTDSLAFVKGVEIDASFLDSRGLALISADSQTEGEHQLVIAYLERDNLTFTLAKESFSWNYGTPIDVVTTRRIGISPNFDEIVILTEESPFAVVFSMPNTVGQRTSYQGPAYLDIGTSYSTFENQYNTAKRERGFLMIDTERELSFLNVK